MKIAIASSGLGHVARGIETWALDTANALARKGCDVTLFAAGVVESECPCVAVSCIRRRTPLSDCIIKLLPRFTWRWGLQSGYGLEQRTFWRHLRRELNAGHYDVLHIQDPMIADLCRKARSAGHVSALEILAHGTEEPLEFLSHFDYLQHLAPWHLQQALKNLGETVDDRPETSVLTPQPSSSQPPLQVSGFPPHPSPPGFPPHPSLHPFWTAMPNFIDTTLYRPVSDVEEKRAFRRTLDIPEDAFVVGTAAAIKKHHKRIDYMIREFADYANQPARKDSDGPVAFLVIAGSRQTDTAELQALAAKLCPEKIKFLVNHPHEQMPDLLRCYDAFVLTSLFEMMPIALLEAIATGLSVITNDHPVLAWMGGSSGIRPDMSQEGALAAVLAGLSRDHLRELGNAAREHALANYSEGAVVAQYTAYYETILAGHDREP